MRFAGHGPRQQRLAGARRPEQQHPMGHPSAQLLIPVGGLQKVDDLGQLALGLVDPSDVVEGHADLLGIDPAGLRATEVAERAADPTAPGRGSPHQQHEQADQQQRGTEPEQQLGPDRRARIRRLRVDLDFLGLQQRSQILVAPERRDFGGEQRRGRRVRVVAGVFDLFRERPLHRVALGRDRLDLARLHFIQEERAERHRHPGLRGRLEQNHRQPVRRQQRDHEDPEPAPAMGRRRFVLVGKAATVGRRSDSPTLLIA